MKMIKRLQKSRAVGTIKGFNVGGVRAFEFWKVYTVFSFFYDVLCEDSTRKHLLNLIPCLGKRE